MSVNQIIGHGLFKRWVRGRKYLWFYLTGQAHIGMSIPVYTCSSNNAFLRAAIFSIEGSIKDIFCYTSHSYLQGTSIVWELWLISRYLPLFRSSRITSSKQNNKCINRLMTVILQYCWWQHFSLCVCGLGEGEGDWSHFLHVVDLTPVHASRTIRLWDMYSKCQPSWLDALQPRIDLTQGSITLDTVNMCYILGNGNTFLRTRCFWSCVFCCQSEYYNPHECFDTLLWFWKWLHVSN